MNIVRDYQAGVCNISKSEENLRLAVGWIGAIVSVILAVVAALAHLAIWWHLALLVTATTSAAGFLQAGMHFCANFGMRGVFNVGDEVGKTQAIIQADFVKKDKSKALLIIALSLAIGAGGTVVSFLLR